MPTALELPTDRPRPSTPSHRGDAIAVKLTQQLSDQLSELSASQGATLFMTLMSAWQLLLWRYWGQARFSVGTAVAGRRSTELEGLIGFFVNTLVIPADFSANPSFTDYLHQTRDRLLSAFAHQDVPFEQVVDYLDPPRDFSRSPLFQVMFAWQNAPLPELQLSGLVLTPIMESMQSAKFDLTLSLGQTTDGQIHGALEYNSDLFEVSTIERMLGHLEQLLESIVKDASRR